MKVDQIGIDVLTLIP